jgi:hypothetical protein
MLMTSLLSKLVFTLVPIVLLWGADVAHAARSGRDPLTIMSVAIAELCAMFLLCVIVIYNTHKAEPN